jgi:hypothetical protein
VRQNLGRRDAGALGDRPRPGRPRAAGKLTDRRRAAVLRRDPRRLGYRTTTWTVALLARHCAERLDCAITERTLRRRLREHASDDVSGLTTPKGTLGFSRPVGDGSSYTCLLNTTSKPATVRVPNGGVPLLSSEPSEPPPAVAGPRTDSSEVVVPAETCVWLTSVDSTQFVRDA